jgi:poly(3-hydroxybutyrate) depolymerase
MKRYNYLLVLASLLCLCACEQETPAAVVSAKEYKDTIATDNYANKTIIFYCYIPAKVLINKPSAVPVLVSVPGLNGIGINCAYPQFKRLADELGMVIIAPSFKWDEANWASETSYQYPAAWSGQAFLSILDKFKRTENVSIAKLYLFGHSAGAQFVLRFSLLYPDMCAACIANAAGGQVTPYQKNNVRYLIGVGTRDSERIGMAEQFANTARQLLIDVTYRQYETDHGLTQQQINDGVQFIRDTLAQTPSVLPSK